MVYVRINKAGSTSISNMVKDVCTILQPLYPRDDRPAGWLAREAVKNEMCFTVVRNPYTRAVSCWGHCVRLGYSYSFREWLEKDFNAMDPKESIHSLRQVDYLRDAFGEIGWIDYVFKLEDPELEQKIQELTGTENELGHEAKGGHTWGWEMSWEAVDLLFLKYYQDFKAFGYYES